MSLRAVRRDSRGLRRGRGAPVHAYVPVATLPGLFDGLLGEPEPHRARCHLHAQRGQELRRSLRYTSLVDYGARRRAVNRNTIGNP